MFNNMSGLLINLNSLIKGLSEKLLSQIKKNTFLPCNSHGANTTLGLTKSFIQGIQLSPSSTCLKYLSGLLKILPCNSHGASFHLGSNK